MYADVIIDISHEQLDKTFQYAVPDELADVIELGMSVDIPFGAGNRQITGYVVGLGDKAAYPSDCVIFSTATKATTIKSRIACGRHSIQPSRLRKARAISP